MRKWRLFAGGGVVALAVALVLARVTLKRAAADLLLSADLESFPQRLTLAGFTSDVLRIEAANEGHNSAWSVAMEPGPGWGFGSFRRPIALPRPSPQWVRFSAWVRAPRDCDVLLELRIEETLSRSPAAHAGDWVHASTTVAVPAGARAVAFGVLLYGRSRVLVDDLKLEALSFAESPVVGLVRGRVVDAQGRGARADLSLVDFSDPALLTFGPAATTSSSETGNFELTAPPGRYALTAVAPHGTVGFIDSLAVAPGPSNPVRVELGSAGVPVTGRILSSDGKPLHNAWVGVRAKGSPVPILVRAGTAGAFSLQLPAGHYYAFAVGNGLKLRPHEFDAEDTGVELRLVVVEGAPPAVASEPALKALRSASAPLRGFQLDGDDDDLAPILQLVGESRAVGVGEATHGSHEFTALRLRLLASLVQRKGFNALALEANSLESAALNDYVQGAPGPVEVLLRRFHFWMYKTVEFREVAEWVREWNAQHPERVTIHGVDMQYCGAEATELSSFLERAEPGGFGEARVLLASCDDQWVPFTETTRTRATALSASLGDVTVALAAPPQAWEARTSPAAIARARLALRAVKQYADLFGSANKGQFFATRDKYLGQNLFDLVQAPETRAVFWAHNGHVSRAKAGKELLVQNLDYRALGFLYGKGQFLGRGPTSAPLGPRDVGPSPPETLEAMLGQVTDGPALFLPTALPEPARTLMTSPQRVRQDGVQEPEETVPAEHFDGVIFVPRMTAMRPLPAD